MAPVLDVEHAYELRRVETMTATVPLVLQDGVKYQDPEDLVINLQELTQKQPAPFWENATEYEVGDEVIYNGAVYRCLQDHISDDDAAVTSLWQIGEFTDFYKPWSPLSGYLKGENVSYGGAVYKCSQDHGPMTTFEKDLWSKTSWVPNIQSRRVASFFATERGQSLAEHMLERARARARRASRYVELTCDCECPDLSLLGPDTAATINDPALPGGSATGKITEYEVTWSDGACVATITIACAPGTGADDTLALGSLSRSTPDSQGEIKVEVKNPGDFQARYFAANGSIPTSIDKDEPIVFEGITVENTMETEVFFESVGAESGDLIGSAEYEIVGECAVPHGVTIS